MNIKQTCIYSCKIVPIERIYIPTPTMGKFIELLSKFEPGLSDIILDLCQPLANKDKINLEYIYKNLKTDSFITSIGYGSFPIKEYNQNTKLNTKRKKHFYNSITITVYNTIENVVVKIFSNGNAQIIIHNTPKNYEYINECVKELLSRIGIISYNTVYNVTDLNIILRYL